jgi:glycosyltransferase involved in cell wall biosynthesis
MTPVNENEAVFPGYDAPFGEQAPDVLPSAEDFTSYYQKEEQPQRPIKLLMGVIGSGNGGMSTYAVKLFQQLPENLYDVTFLSTVEHPFFEKEIRDHYGKIKVIPSRLRHPFAHKKALQKIMAETAYDACHIHLSTASNIEPLKAAVEAKIPVILAHIHSSEVEGSGLARLLHKRNVPKLGALPIRRLAVSDAAGKFAYGSAAYTVVPNGIDLDRFYWEEGRRARFRSYHHLPKDAFVMGHVGRFVPVKNHAFLLELFAEVKKQRADAHLLLCGDGPLLDEIKKKAADMGLAEDVTFTGNIVNPQDAYCAMDVMVLPSQFEGFPLSVIEGYAAGLPCLVSDTVTKEVGIGELVEFFSLQDDKTELAARLLAMEQPERRSYTDALRARGLDAGTQVERMQRRYRGEEV